MRLLNCGLDEIANQIGNNRIVFFGSGSWLKVVNHTELMTLADNFCYVIDNGLNKDEVQIGNITLPIYPPSKVLDETKCVVILTSPMYMNEMYEQLQDMSLSDEIVCYAFPFMQMVTEDKTDINLLEKVTNKNVEKRIPKIIHSFWFSGDEKPDSYQQCVDTWKKILPDYEIIEWNKNNYDWHKHPFVERAIELEAWAFASDYARLDVLFQFGGIYLDMDVEVFKPFDELLGNEAILAFSNHVLIDLAVVGSKRNNPLIKKILELYDGVELPTTKKEFAKYFQPVFVRDCLAEADIKMNGSLQKVDGATVFPRQFFMAMNYVLFGEYKLTENTYCVHHDNFGWSVTKDREKKMRDNNLLWQEIENK